MLNLAWITSTYFPGYSAQSINFGHCFNWAYCVFVNYKNVQLYTIDEGGGHAFVKIGKKFYDSENPKGVTNWRRLKSVRNMVAWENDIIYTARRQKVETFRRYWSRNGAYRMANERDVRRNRVVLTEQHVMW